jgi:hypothetical protein
MSDDRQGDGAEAGPQVRAITAVIAVDDSRRRAIFVINLIRSLIGPRAVAPFRSDFF